MHCVTNRMADNGLSTAVTERRDARRSTNEHKAVAIRKLSGLGGGADSRVFGGGGDGVSVEERPGIPTAASLVTDAVDSRNGGHPSLFGLHFGHVPWSLAPPRQKCPQSASGPINLRAMGCVLPKA
ncbi:hypothetical protein L798_04995 [Zootermopsis nevadensis]|uniref:Uncharacterized protein n=1 Tax=Zootermopsis nevadensis TaxID=136037 RepID=A0A067RJB2_ZOONE|nr:hypothetical protein L798_04995 [Zootermopsis nevadensis]